MAFELLLRLQAPPDEELWRVQGKAQLFHRTLQSRLVDDYGYRVIGWEIVNSDEENDDD
ncbi:MAG: hypothetical protein AAF581_11015 [Planctomycetota bacterium]